MKVNDIVKQVATFLQLSNIASANLAQFDECDEQTKKDVELVVSCINEILSDVATDYLPLEYVEDIEVFDGSFDLLTLSKDFHKIVKINTSNPYKVVGDTLFVDSGKYTITYRYLPKMVALNDEIEGFSRALTPYAISYGVASEYCLICGNYSESEMWGSRYDNAMQIAMRMCKIVSLKERRWI